MATTNPLDLENFFSQELKIPVVLSLCFTEPDLNIFSLKELEILNSFKFERRKTSWKKSRAALKNLLLRKQIDTETTTWTFPNRHISLSHTQEIGAALGMPENTFAPLNIDGIGLDVERIKEFKIGGAKFFMQNHELEYLHSLEEAQQLKEALRIWTVKEAVFKSDPDNQSRSLKEYQLFSPSTITGKAQHPGHGGRFFLYSSREYQGNWISVALFPGRERS